MGGNTKKGKKEEDPIIGTSRITELLVADCLMVSVRDYKVEGHWKESTYCFFFVVVVNSIEQIELDALPILVMIMFYQLC